MQLFKDPRINFMVRRKLFFWVSLGLMGISFVSLVLNGGPNYGIDFLGGYQLILKFEEEVNDLNYVRDQLNSLNLGNVEAKRIGVGGTQEIQITIEQFSREEQSVEWVVDQLRQKMGQDTFELLGETMVGPRIGSELRVKALKAILISLLFIVLYIWFRFEFWFGISAIIALFHDVFITLGVFSVLDKEVTLPIVAAGLTIIGYSLNDTIVIFDRIRENLKTARRDELSDVVDRSINASISRTVITSFTTFMVVMVLAIFGGNVIRDFAVALCVGVVIGTYSSIYVASPLMMIMRTSWEERRRAKLTEGKHKK
jgi:preprotein translocase subunit SecF